jgi:UDP-glucuronate decarboxylase
VQPKAVYGHSKADAEAEIRRSISANPRGAAILRLTNLYGSPWDHVDRVIPAFVTRARLGQPLEVRGPGQVLDFLHVRDAVRAIVRTATLLEESPNRLETFNIASGGGVTIRQLADQVVDLTGSGSRVVEVAPESWTPSKFVADISLARSVLGWGPTIPLRQGLSDLSAAYGSLARSP